MWSVKCGVTSEKSVIPHSTLHIAFLSFFLLAACGDFMEPVESTPEPTAYEFNYWLLKQTYLYEEDLENLPIEGDSIPLLYSSLNDKYTRYYPPSKSESAESHMNTSIVEGDLGMEYMSVYVEGESSVYPILITRVYEDSPAGRAKVPRYGRIISANDTSLDGPNAKAVYDSIVAYSAEVSLVVLYNDSLLHYDLTKETIYAPTVFLDTLSNITFISITEFKASTANREQGTLGELQAYLDSTKDESSPRVLDLRYNPGGLINQCIPAADLFVKEGPLSIRHIVTLSPDGKRSHTYKTTDAESGGPGENGKFILLANSGSASCAEIFIAAVKEQGKVPLVGETTFGKGIGQSQWKTMEGGLAVITNLEFYTPNGNAYNKKGISPDIECPEGASRTCALDAISSLYGSNHIKKASAHPTPEIQPRKATYYPGGALDTVTIFVNYSHIP